MARTPGSGGKKFEKEIRQLLALDIKKKTPYQTDACKAYIQSQKHEGWVLVEKTYSDGGISGGTLNRPALQELLEDIKSGLVDIIVVYKIDRLTRSLHDFSKLVEVFDKHQTSFLKARMPRVPCLQGGKSTAEHHPAI